MSFCKGSVLLLQLREQAHVLDRDDGLIGEGLEQRDLAVGKWTGRGTTYRDDADGLVIAHHGYGQTAAKPHRVAHRSVVLPIQLDVRDVDDGPFEDRSA